MKIKNNDLIVATSFLNLINNADHGIRFAFKVSTIINRVNKAVELIDNMKKKILETGTLKDEKGETVFVDKEQKYLRLTDEGSTQLTELMECESELEFEQFTMDELEKNNVTIKPAEIPFVSWLIK